MVPTIFLQTFVIGVCVAGFVAVVLTNQLKLNLPKRLGLGIVIVGLAYFVATALQKTSTSQVAPPLASNPHKGARGPLALWVGKLGPLRGDDLVNLQDSIGVKLGLVGSVGMVVAQAPKFARLGDAAGQDGAARGDIHVGL